MIFILQGLVYPLLPGVTVGAHDLYLTGKGTGILAETLFILLLILLSKGWTVVRYVELSCNHYNEHNEHDYNEHSMLESLCDYSMLIQQLNSFFYFS